MRLTTPRALGAFADIIQFVSSRDVAFKQGYSEERDARIRSFELLRNACNRNEPRDVNIASEQIERNLDVSWELAFSPGQRYYRR